MTAVELFGNLKGEAGLVKLNDYLGTRSYITGYSATQDDVSVFNSLLGLPKASTYTHANRWYRHISHFSPLEKATWPKGQFNTEEKKVEKEEDFDLFGDDARAEKDTAELKKLAEQKQKEVEAKKGKKKVVNRSSLVIEVKPANINTDLDEVARLCKEIQIEGVTWGAAVKKVPVAFGLYKLQLCCTILDDVVNTNEIVDHIEALGMNEEQREKLRKRQDGADSDDEDEEEEKGGFVQSAEIVSFNKL